MTRAANTAPYWLRRLWIVSTLWWSFPGTASWGQAVPPPVPREFRGAWVATVENIDWPSSRALTIEEQQRELTEIVDLARELRLNALIFQVRPACDALYASDLEPWSAYLTGTAGQDPGYDPLEFAVQAAHARGLELHAWFNPYRARHASFQGELPESHVCHRHPEWVRSYGEYRWLDPGEPAAVNHTIAVVLDVIRRYDVDGIHIDDYFYPYPIQDDDNQEVPFPDDQTYAARPASDQGLSLEDWRRANVNRFVERLYREVKAVRPSVKVGISPFGIWRPGHPPTIRGFDPYVRIYADARKWLQAGWLDYLTPQLYWAIDRPAQSYPVLLKWWQEQNLQQRHLWPGNFTSRLHARSGPVWRTDEIVQQIQLTRQQPGATGNVHFSMNAFLKNSEQINDRLRQQVYVQQALIPACDWLSTAAPGRPRVEVRREQNAAVLHWQPEAGTAAAQWVIQYQAGDTWDHVILPGSERHFVLPSSAGAARLVAVSRTGQESDEVRITVD